MAEALATDAPATELSVSEPLTWDEICERYPRQWVVLVEIEWLSDNNFAFQTARVAGSGKTRREPLDQARPLRFKYPSFGHFFTGPIAAPLPQMIQ